MFRKHMRWREKFLGVKICDNELGGHLPHTLCSPQLPPFYNFFGEDQPGRCEDQSFRSKPRLRSSQLHGAEAGAASGIIRVLAHHLPRHFNHWRHERRLGYLKNKQHMVARGGGKVAPKKRRGVYYIYIFYTYLY